MRSIPRRNRDIFFDLSSSCPLPLTHFSLHDLICLSLPFSLVIPVVVVRHHHHRHHHHRRRRRRCTTLYGGCCIFFLCLLSPGDTRVTRIYNVFEID
jgi:hypothetical protein